MVEGVKIERHPCPKCGGTDICFKERSAGTGERYADPHPANQLFRMRMYVWALCSKCGYAGPEVCCEDDLHYRPNFTTECAQKAAEAWNKMCSEETE